MCSCPLCLPRNPLRTQVPWELGHREGGQRLRYRFSRGEKPSCTVCSRVSSSKAMRERPCCPSLPRQVPLGTVGNDMPAQNTRLSCSLVPLSRAHPSPSSASHQLKHGGSAIPGQDRGPSRPAQGHTHVALAVPPCGLVSARPASQSCWTCIGSAKEPRTPQRPHRKVPSVPGEA